MILHITTRAAWEDAQAARVYRAPSLETEGFIHFSTAAQVTRVADAFYRGEPDLVLLVVDPKRVQSPVRYEPPAEDATSGERFPHLYGTLNLDAVTDVVPFPPNADGSFSLPEKLARLR